MGVRRPASGRLGGYLPLPFGLGPSPGWNDSCVREVLGVAKRVRPSRKVVDFVDDSGPVGDTGDRAKPFAGTGRFMEVPSKVDVCFYVKPPKGLWPSQATPWLEFEYDDKAMRRRRTAEK